MPKLPSGVSIVTESALSLIFKRRTKELQDQRQAEITKWAASLAAREGRLARAERLYFERTGHRVDEAAGKE